MRAGKTDPNGRARRRAAPEDLSAETCNAVIVTSVVITAALLAYYIFVLVGISQGAFPRSHFCCWCSRGSSAGSRYSRPSGPMAVTWVTYSPDFAQWKWDVLPGRTMTLPAGYASTLSPSN